MLTKSALWPENSLQHLGRCPACGSENRDVVFTDMPDIVFGCAPGTWTIWQCGECSSGYLDPRPDELSIGMAYESYYTHNDDPSRTFLGRLMETSMFAKAYNGRLSLKYGIVREPSSKTLGRLLNLIPLAGAYLDPLGRAIPKPSSEKARLLDFGCGNGEFLSMAREAGWQCKGIDFDGKAVAVARGRGLDAIQGGVEELERERGHDLICMSHVIEHVHDPERVLKACRDALSPGGELWIETPNFIARGRERYGKFWRGLEVPRHLAIFTPRSLSDLLCRCGFEDVAHRPVLFYFGVYQASRSLRKNGELKRKRLTDLLHPSAVVDGTKSVFGRDKADFIRMTSRRARE